MIINNHDYARYLGIAIQSALEQDHRSLEVIVVDDGSRDGSAHVIHGFGARITPVFKPAEGQTSAMNAGLARASGDVVLFLDSDDVLGRNAISSAVAAFDDEGVVKVHWPMTVIDEDGASLDRLVPEQDLPAGELLATAVADGPQALAFPPTSGNAWRRAFLDEVFPLPMHESAIGVGSASADALLSMLAPFAGRVAALAEPLSAYRVHGRNDYAGTDARERISRHVKVTDLQFDVIERFSLRRGVPVDVTAWRRSSYFHRLSAARDVMLRELPADGCALLIDGGEWDAGLLPLREVHRFPERDGVWWGFPVDDETAQAELRETLSGAVTCALVTWDCRWWLDAYPGLRKVLDQMSRTILHTPDVSIYHLRGRGGGGHVA